MKHDFPRALNYTTKILDAWLPLKIQYDQIPGLTVGIVYKGELIYQRGFGYADVEAKIPMTPQTCFRIASISKSFTAVAIMQLVEKEKIHLDDRVEKYLPWFKVHTQVGDSRNITIRQLLSHTAGVYRDGVTPHWEDDVFPDLSELKKSISEKTLVFENLTRFKYSNFGFALLGEVIRQVSGTDYDEYVKLHIIEKLGMQRTAPDFSEKSESWLAKGCSRVIPGRERQVYPQSKTNAYSSATGFVSNVPDLAKFLTALSLKHDEANKLLSQESKKEMMKPYWDTGQNNESYGFGVNITPFGRKKLLRHSGQFAGFSTQFFLDNENDISLICLTNTNDDFCKSVGRGILETVYRLAEKPSNPEMETKIIDPEKYEGIYRSRWLDRVVTSLDSHLISFSVETDSPLTDATILIPKGKNTFVMETKSNFDRSGETATFVFEKQESTATRVIFGSIPSERLKT